VFDFLSFSKRQKTREVKIFCKFEFSKIKLEKIYAFARVLKLSTRDCAVDQSSDS